MTRVVMKMEIMKLSPAKYYDGRGYRNPESEMLDSPVIIFTKSHLHCHWGYHKHRSHFSSVM